MFDPVEAFLVEIAVEEMRGELREVQGGQDFQDAVDRHNIVECQVVGGPLDGSVFRVPESLLKEGMIRSMEELVRMAEFPDAQ